MHVHGVYVPEKTQPLKSLNRVNWYLERERDRFGDSLKCEVLRRRPRTRLSKVQA